MRSRERPRRDITSGMSAEYVDDVPYVRHFVGELSPVRLRLVAALNGVTPPSGDDFDYLEIGCAHGDTLAAMAAAHPRARFVGVDLSAAHVASAKKLAREGGLENVGVLERAFSALADEDVGEFDYVVAHGVLSWISPEKRQALLALASAKLKPGGLLFVSYNAMPGWGAVEPLRQLLLFGGVGDTSLARAERGLAFARAMEAAGAAYFTGNPAASKMLETMTAAGLPYVAHEYLHEHWIPMYFARVASEMAACDLHFAGVLPIYLNFRVAALSEEQERLLAPVSDRVTFESLKDFAVAEFFRRDVYVKGAARRSPGVATAYLDGTPWLGAGSAPKEERVVRLPQRTLPMDGPAFDALLDALEAGSVSLPELAASRDIPPDDLRGAILRLLVADRAIPLRSPARPASQAEMFSIPCAYNQTMLRRMASDAPIVLASEIAGTAIPISALDGLALRVLTEVTPAARERWIEELVARSVLRMRAGDRVVVEPQEQRKAILDAVEQLRAHRLRKFLELGVVSPAS
jgi:SAM-dependent methyltransferase